MPTFRQAETPNAALLAFFNLGLLEIIVLGALGVGLLFAIIIWTTTGRGGRDDS